MEKIIIVKFFILVNVLCVLSFISYDMENSNCVYVCKNLYLDIDDDVLSRLSYESNCCHCYDSKTKDCLNCNYDLCEKSPCSSKSDCTNPLYPECKLRINSHYRSTKFPVYEYHCINNTYYEAHRDEYL